LCGLSILPRTKNTRLLNYYYCQSLSSSASPYLFPPFLILRPLNLLLMAKSGCCGILVSNKVILQVATMAKWPQAFDLISIQTLSRKLLANTFLLEILSYFKATQSLLFKQNFDFLYRKYRIS